MRDGRITMPFGKYRGEFVGDVPASYLIWAYNAGVFDTYKELFEYVNDNYDELVREADRASE